MAKPQESPAEGFTPGERDYIRRELDMFFSTYPTVAEALHPLAWAAGRSAGKAVSIRAAMDLPALFSPQV
jgi:hypothetical protein